MRLYAQRPDRLIGQILADVIAIAFLIVSIVLAVAAWNAIHALSAIGAQLTAVGQSFAATFDEAAEALGEVPIVGNGLRVPFDQLSDTAEDVIAAGIAQQTATNQLAWLVAIALVVLPTLLLLVVWVMPRVRGARRAGAVQRLAETPAGVRILALRAIAGQPAAKVMVISEDPLADLLGDNEHVRARLAALELRDAGFTRTPVAPR